MYCCSFKVGWRCCASWTTGPEPKFNLHCPTNLHEQRQLCTGHKRGSYEKISSSPIHVFNCTRESDSSSPESK